MYRKEPIVTGKTYHIFNRSIAKYVIFNGPEEYGRMLEMLQHYLADNPGRFARTSERPPEDGASMLARAGCGDLVSILGYCLMPTHFHLILRQEKEAGISTYIGNLQNSYARYFNIKHNRQGPLWSGRYKNVRVRSAGQLLHLTRYVHLNPTTDRLVDRPGQWPYSSYQHYIKHTKEGRRFLRQIDAKMTIGEYRQFNEGGMDYQRKLKEVGLELAG